MVKKHSEEDESISKHKKKNSPKTYNPFKVLLVIGGIVLGFIILFWIIASLNNSSRGSNNNYNPSQNTPQTSCQDVQTPYEEQEEYMKTEYYTESVPYTDRECETKNLAYSVDNTAFDYNICNKYEDLCIKYTLGFCTEKKTYCIDRSASCSLLLRNLDSEQGGTWTVRHSFFEQGTNNIVKTSDSSIYLYAQTSQKISGQIRIISQGENGDANRDIGNCNYQITSIPTKQVCRDVIKYQEVQKERQVTAYRPVTKYRTEQKCS